MAEEKKKRKLAAIFSADVKGYSRLMADDEEATVNTINAYRDLMTDFIQKHDGRVVDAKGDNILAEFPSVVDAVRCAADVQRELKTRNANLPEHRRMEFRIGVNLGDVIDEDGLIYGDGVNVAARLEGLAEGGGICISGTAFDQVKNRLSVGYTYQGKQSVKNIPDPVRVYKALLEPEDAGKVIGEEEPKKNKRQWVAIAAILVLVAVGGLIWNFYFRPDMEPASLERMAFPLLDKPSIAVLPFVNMSDDPKQEYFSDGITEDIITALSKTPKMLVIARNSTFSYKGRAVKVQQIAEELGVRYILEGSVRKSENQVRITAQLIDALKGYHLWAEHYDRDLKDIFKLQDEITKQVITELQIELTEGEQARLTAKGTDNIDAYLSCMEGREHLFRFNRDENLKARREAERAIALDPNYSDAYSLLGKTHIMDVWFKWSDSPKASMGQAYELAEKALALKEDNFEAHRILSNIYLLNRQHDKAIAECELAVKLAPNAADCIYSLGVTLRFSGRTEEAISAFEKAIRLNPIPPPSYLYQLGLTYAFFGKFDKAIELCKRALPQNPNDLVGRVALAVAYVSLGREGEARREADEILRINPDFNLEYYAKTWPYKNPDDRDLVLNALRKAGLPETPALPLPDKPSIAVLPFTNMSGDPKQEYLSDGITESIIAAISKIRRLFVIARTSSFKYKGKEIDVRTVGRELGVQYVLEGGVQRSGDRLRITGQLIDALNGNHIWSQRYDRELKDLFAMQDDITMEILEAMRVKLIDGEQVIRAKRPKNIEIALKGFQAWDYGYRFTPEANARAKKLAEEVVAEDPDWGEGYYILACAHMMDVWLGTTRSPKESLDKAIAFSEKAVYLDDSLSQALGLLGYVFSMKGQWEKSVAYAEKGVAVDPNGADAHAWLGNCLNRAGRPQEAVHHYEKAMRLNPYPPQWYYINFGTSYNLLGHHEESVAQLKKALAVSPNSVSAYSALIVTYGIMGKEDEARAAAAELLRINPNFSAENYTKSLSVSFKDKEYPRLAAEALRKAGLK